MVMSKKLLVIFITLFLLTSCGYSSMYEAEKACWKWVTKGGTYKYEHDNAMSKYFSDNIFNGNDDSIATIRLRSCEPEKQTNQLLGFEVTNIRNGAYYKMGEERPSRKEKLVKRFKY